MQINKISLFKNPHFTSQTEGKKNNNSNQPLMPPNNTQDSLRLFDIKTITPVKTAKNMAQNTLLDAKKLEKEATKLVGEVKPYAETLINSAIYLYQHDGIRGGKKIADIIQGDDRAEMIELNPARKKSRKTTFTKDGFVIVEETDENGTNRYAWDSAKKIMFYNGGYSKDADGVETTEKVFEMHNNKLRYIKGNVKYPNGRESNDEMISVSHTQNRKLMVYMMGAETFPDKSAKTVKTLRTLDDEIVEYIEDSVTHGDESEEEGRSIEFEEGKVKSYSENISKTSEGGINQGKILSVMG